MMDPNLMQRRLTTGSVQQNEFLLQGSILDESRDALLHKLRGFCDHSDLPPQNFHDHELVYVISEYFCNLLSQHAVLLPFLYDRAIYWTVELVASQKVN